MCTRYTHINTEFGGVSTDADGTHGVHRGATVGPPTKKRGSARPKSMEIWLEECGEGYLEKCYEDKHMLPLEQMYDSIGMDKAI
ncbi:hypothetical protein L484_025112 [Morus notabilis]|uniref:Uncharacterized protein n=1 Tax=Morus notabilis TaxID=981085 RepID=W9RAL9_9ROSA|nr:hypothetical protein L484_025112 [Morus notabilis]